MPKVTQPPTPELSSVHKQAAGRDILTKKDLSNVGKNTNVLGEDDHYLNPISTDITNTTPPDEDSAEIRRAIKLHRNTLGELAKR